MKPSLFDYHAVTSVDEAVALLGAQGDDAKILAGGQSLIPLLNLRLARVSCLVDVNGVAELSRISEISEGKGLELGAIVRQRDAERSELVAARNPLLGAALRLIAHTAIRTRGTIGGSVAHADPAAELPTLLLAMDGDIAAASIRGSRTIRAADLYTGFLSTSLEADELLTAVRLPGLASGTGWSYREFSRRCGDFAIVGVAALLELEAGVVTRGRLAFSGVASTPVRAVETEAALQGHAACPALWMDAAQTAARELDPPGDLHGTASYRRHLAAVLARRALHEAHERAEATS